MKRFVAIALMLVMMTALLVPVLSGCKKRGSGVDISFDENGNLLPSSGTTIHVTSYSEGDEEKRFYQLCDAFNEKYKEYNIRAVYEPSDSSGYEQTMKTSLSSSTCQDVLLVSDSYYKQWATLGYLEPLDAYIKSQYAALNFEKEVADMYEGGVGRYLYDVVTTTSDGPNAHYYGLPKGTGATAIYYNKTYMKNANIKEISVYEEDIDAFNGGAADAYGNTKASLGINGTVPKKAFFTVGGQRVFNNKIPMSWQECSELAAILQAVNAAAGCKYGFITSWWFNYGFSVGGSCMQYLTSDDTGLTGGYYTFTLADSTVNYKAKEDIAVNGHTYKAGEIVSYEDKFYMSDTLAEKCEVLPSQREAFAEYMSLAGKVGNSHYHADVTYGGKTYTGVTDAFWSVIPYQLGATPKEAIAKNEELLRSPNNLGDPGSAGALAAASHEYVIVQNKGISVNPATLNTDGRFTQFTQGYTAMVVDVRVSVAQARLIRDFEWDVAPMLVWKDFDGEGNTIASGVEGAHSGSNAWAVWSKSTIKNAAYLFLKFAAGEDGQKILAEAGTIIPNQKSIAKEMIQQDLAKGLSPRNIEVFERGAEYQTPGDWWFLKDGDWIDGDGCWANYLNQTVRNFKATMTTFYTVNDYLKTFDTLKKYTAKED